MRGMASWSTPLHPIPLHLKRGLDLLEKAREKGGGAGFLGLNRLPYHFSSAAYFIQSCRGGGEGEGGGDRIP